MSKNRAGDRRSGDFGSVRWSSGREWDKASLSLSEDEGSYLLTAANYEVHMNREDALDVSLVSGSLGKLSTSLQTRMRQAL